jgi:ribonuclease P protein component
LLHLTAKAQFQLVLSGPPVARTPHFALHHAPLHSERGLALFPASPSFWMGVLLPKRWAKRAVTRNAIRRQIYETARTCPAFEQLTGAYVVRLRSGFSRHLFVSATSEQLKTAVRLELLQLYAHWAARASRQAQVGGGGAVSHGI